MSFRKIWALYWYGLFVFAPVDHEIESRTNMHRQRGFARVVVAADVQG